MPRDFKRFSEKFFRTFQRTGYGQHVADDSLKNGDLRFAVMLFLFGFVDICHKQISLAMMELQENQQSCRALHIGTGKTHPDRLSNRQFLKKTFLFQYA